MKSREKQASNQGRRAALTKRLNIRTTERQEKLIRLGAERMGLNVSSFVLSSACAEAEQSLANQSHFTLSPLKWTRFLAALDRPAEPHRELAKLMSEPGILEQ